MATESEIDAMAAKLAQEIYHQFIENVSRSVPLEWTNPIYDDPEDKTYTEIAKWARSLSTDDQRMLSLVVGRASANVLLKVGGLLSGTYGLGAVDGKQGVFELLYDGSNIGQDLAHHLQNLVEDAEASGKGYG